MPLDEAALSVLVHNTALTSKAQYQSLYADPTYCLFQGRCLETIFSTEKGLS